MNTEQVTNSYRKLQDGLFESTRKLWLAGLGTLSVVEEEGTELFDELVKKGRKIEEKSRKRLGQTKAELESGTDELAEKLDRQVSGVLQKMGVPSRAQVQDLTVRVEQLTEQERNLLRFSLLDSLTYEQIAAIYTVHRVTIRRWMSKLRDKLLDQTRGILSERLDVDQAELDSIVRLINSELHVSISRLLRRDR